MDEYDKYKGKEVRVVSRHQDVGDKIGFVAEIDPNKGITILLKGDETRKAYCINFKDEASSYRDKGKDPEKLSKELF